MATIELAKVSKTITAAVQAAMDAVPDTRLRLYDIDAIPPEPTPPYGACGHWQLGYEWDVDMGREAQSGMSGWYVMGVGLAEVDALWVCDVVRGYVSKLGVLPVDGDLVTTRVKSLSSQGPPSSAAQAGTLYTCSETYEAFVEAS